MSIDAAAQRVIAGNIRHNGARCVAASHQNERAFMLKWRLMLSHVALWEQY